jgi:hypothetical protein
MKTLINFEINEQELCNLFSVRRIALSLEDVSKIAITKLSNGIVYYYDGIYSVGDSNNRIFQVIITTSAHPGITMIDTKKVSKNKKRLTKQMALYLTTLHGIIADPENAGKRLIRSSKDHTLGDFREQILIDNKQETVKK